MRVVVVLASLVLLLAGASLAFAVQPGAGQAAEPVAFSDTLVTGLTGVDVRQAESAGYEIPRVEVFYSQYEYVVGYYGVDAALRDRNRDATTRQFGRPIAAYVTDFAGAGPRLTDEGYLTVATDPAVGWVRAADAFFVVDSGARTPAGPTIVPFSDRTAASAFVAAYGGTITGWDDLEAREAESTAGALRNRTDTRRSWANRTVQDRATLLERPVSVVVGEDEPTLSAALRAAAPNTTIRLPAGTYDGNLTVSKPVTIRGAGERTRIVGDGNGSVLDVRAPRTALAEVSIAGVGERNTGSPQADASANGTWDESIRRIYGHGDAAVVLDGANRSLLDGVAIETPSSGVIVRDSDDTVVGEATIDGTDTWREGFMSVLAINSRIVVENSTFEGGRDAVYTHHADGIVVRNNRMTGMRFGVHEMFSSESLVANNTVRGTNIGIVVMTRPRSNAILGNEVVDSGVGVSMGGSASLVADNVVRGNRYGMDMGAQRSVFARNVVVGNEIGLRTGTIVPTNRVRDNDVVANDRYARTGRGPTRVWSGNYWGTIPGIDHDGDGAIDRHFRPTGVVDGTVGASSGAATLASSPAVTAIRRFQAAVPGLRVGTVLDDRPRTEPARPDALTQALNASAARRADG